QGSCCACMTAVAACLAGTTAAGHGRGRLNPSLPQNRPSRNAPTLTCMLLLSFSRRNASMERTVQGIVTLLLATSLAAGDAGQNKVGTPAEQYTALPKEFQEAASAFYLKATTDEDRVEPMARIIKLSPRCLELAKNNPKDPVALDA